MPSLDHPVRFRPLPVAAGLLGGLALEALALHSLLVSPERLWGHSLPLHLAASLLLTATLWLGLPGRVRRPTGGILTFLLATLVLLPGVGALGLALSVLPALHTSRQREKVPWQALPMPDLPFRTVPPLPANDPAIREGLGSVLSGVGNPERRQQAILACRHLPRRQAIPLLRQGLTDPADDVRLLAYSMLNAIEGELDSQVRTLTIRLEEDDDAEGRHAEALAMLHWEYAYLGLAQGSTLRYLLERARQHIDRALARHETAQRWLLRGRLGTAMDDPETARHAFIHCERLGMHDDDLAPHRAELAFRERRVDEIRRQLARLSPAASRIPVLHPVVNYWRTETRP